MSIVSAFQEVKCKFLMIALVILPWAGQVLVWFAVDADEMEDCE